MVQEGYIYGTKLLVSSNWCHSPVSSFFPPERGSRSCSYAWGLKVTQQSLKANYGDVQTHNAMWLWATHDAVWQWQKCPVISAVLRPKHYSTLYQCLNVCENIRTNLELSRCFGPNWCSLIMLGLMEVSAQNVLRAPGWEKLFWRTNSFQFAFSFCTYWTNTWAETQLPLEIHTALSFAKLFSYQNIHAKKMYFRERCTHCYWWKQCTGMHYVRWNFL